MYLPMDLFLQFTLAWDWLINEDSLRGRGGGNRAALRGRWI